MRIVALLVTVLTAWITAGPGARSALGNQATRGNDRAAQEHRAVKTVTSKDGTRIAFDQTGSGPTVILVAGALSDRRSGMRLAAQLAPNFTVISYDRRGRGDSGDTQPYSVQREVEDIEALVDHAGGSALIFGSSSGAALALEATSTLPDKIKAAALFEPPFITDDSRPPLSDEFPAQVKALLASNQGGDAVALFMTQAVLVPAPAVEQMKQSPMWGGMVKLAPTLAYDLEVMGETLFGKPLPQERWASVKTRVLVLDGGASDAWLRNSAKSLAGVLPSAEHRTLEGQTHAAPFVAPQVIAPVLVEFFGPAR